MKNMLIMLMINFPIISLAQNDSNLIQQKQINPVFYLDSVKVLQSDFENLNPNDIESITIFKDTNAIKLIGPGGKDGVIYIETKKFVKQRYWKFLSGRSAEYAQLVPTTESDSSVQYILNKVPLKKNEEGKLSVVIKDFISLKLIDRDALKDQYNIADKTHGVVITTLVPIEIQGPEKEN